MQKEAEGATVPKYEILYPTIEILKKIEIVSKLLKNGGTVTIVLAESEKN